MRTVLLTVLAAAPLLADATLRGRVTDADTGRPIASTLTIGKAKSRVEGAFTKSIPAGTIRVTISRGFDYTPVERTIESRDGETAGLEVALRRQSPLKRLGWVTGDSHVHMIHGERTLPVDFPSVALAGRAEGLDSMAVAQAWPLPVVTPEALAEACRRVSTPDFLMTWNLEAPKNYWRGDSSTCVGHGWTVGMQGRTKDGRDAVAELLTMSTMDDEPGKTNYPNFEIQALIHSLGGIVSYTHPHRWWTDAKGKFVSNLAAELPFDTVAGPTYDTIDVMMRVNEREVNRKGLALWFMLLNHGYRIAATASSDATFDRPGGDVPGAVRVYTRVEGAPTIDKIAAAMKAGRNFVTSGPLILFSAGGHEVGDIVKAPAKLTAEIQAWPAGTKIELVRNGEVVRTFDSDHARFEIDERGTAWYVARVEGAITNPIYFEGPDYRAPVPATAHVRATVAGPKSGTVEVLEYVGLEPFVRRSFPYRDGAFEVDVPATARLRVRAEDSPSQTKSIFIDTPEILNSVLTMRSETLADWATFERTREMLRNVRLAFDIKR